jgi:hypothetical protein
MVHCLGGSLKPEGLGDGPKLNSRLPRAQLLLMNRITNQIQRPHLTLTEVFQFVKIKTAPYGFPNSIQYTQFNNFFLPFRRAIHI